MRLYPTLAAIFLTVATSAHSADSRTVSSATFPMGCSHADPDCETDEGPAGGTEVSVPAFRIDRFEVTVADYRTCVEAGDCTLPLTEARNKYCNSVVHTVSTDTGLQGQSPREEAKNARTA